MLVGLPLRRSQNWMLRDFITDGNVPVEKRALMRCGFQLQPKGALG